MQLLRQAVSIKYIVAERQGAGVVPDEFPADQEGLGQPVRARLYCVIQRHSPLAAIAQEPVKIGALLRCGDYQDVPDSRQHQDAQRVVDHRLVVDGQELFAHSRCHGIEPCAFSPGEDDTLVLHGLSLRQSSATSLCT